MALYVGDLPPGPIEVDPPVEVDDLDTAEAKLVDPAGAETPADTEIDDDGIILVTIPGPSPFLVPGVYSLRVVLRSSTVLYSRVTLPPVSLVVQDVDSEWHTLDSAREGWADANHVPDRVLWEILEQARTDVLAFAPALDEGEAVPPRYRKGQKLHAKNILTAGLVAPDGNLGDEDFVIRPFPLDWHVQQTVRPRRARGAIR